MNSGVLYIFYMYALVKAVVVGVAVLFYLFTKGIAINFFVVA